MNTIEVWLEYASTYSWLTVARIGALADARGITLDWRPFLLTPVRMHQQLPHPFPEGSPRLAYMWRDLERRAHRLGVPYRKPEAYPVDSMLTARVAMLAAGEGWCRAFTEQVFTLHWTQGRLIGTEDNIVPAIAALGRDPRLEIARAQSDPNKAALKAQTQEALQRGVFGSPSFIVNGELFWGDDRLEDALDHAV